MLFPPFFFFFVADAPVDDARFSSLCRPIFHRDDYFSITPIDITRCFLIVAALFFFTPLRYSCHQHTIFA